MRFSSLRKLMSVLLIAGASGAAAAASFPHGFQISIDAVPFQKDQTVYDDNTAWYSGWGAGLEAGVRYVSPIGITLGLRGGVINTPYLGDDMLHYTAGLTLGYRIPAGRAGLGIEAFGGIDLIDYKNTYSRPVMAGGRVYFEMPVSDEFRLDAGCGVFWHGGSPVPGNTAFHHRISVPVTVGFTYHIPLDEKGKAIVEKEPMAPVPGNPVVLTEAPGFMLALSNEALMAVSELGKTDAPSEDTALNPYEGRSGEEIMAMIEGCESIELPEPAADDKTIEAEEALPGGDAVPRYVLDFFSVPEGEPVPEDILSAMIDNTERFSYTWGFRRVSLDPDSPVREAWVIIKDPETGAELRREITQSEAARFSAALREE